MSTKISMFQDLSSLLNVFTIFLCCVRVRVHAYYNMHAVARGLVEVGSLLLSCASWGLNSVAHAWQSPRLWSHPANLYDAPSDLPGSAKSPVFCLAIWLLLVTALLQEVTGFVLLRLILLMSASVCI